jgi:plastocyanin
MQAMKGARALASGTLALVAVCAVPAISPAQDADTTTGATTTTTHAEPSNPAPESTPADVPSDTPPAEASPGSTRPTSSEPSEDGSAASRGVPAAAPAAIASAASPRKAKKSASASVTMGDLFFSPSSVTVAVGDTVTWRNTGEAPHNATADDGSFRTPDLNKGGSASHTFDQAGTFSYICTIHPQMKGTVRVLSASSGGGGGGGGGAGSSASGSGTSEASAVASPDAAGDSNTLPMTGMAVGALALVGLALLGSGLLLHGAVRRGITPF